MKLSPVILLFALVIAKSKAVAQEGKIASLDTLISNAYEKKWFNGAIVVGQYGKGFALNLISIFERKQI